jgi:hypothetical protein
VSTLDCVVLGVAALIVAEFLFVVVLWWRRPEDERATARRQR